jgi:geranylgeranyl diphosphate synthase type II
MTDAPSPAELARHVRRRLTDELDGILGSAPELATLIESYLERPAKLIRPRLLVETALAHGADDATAVLDLAAGTELLHLFALIHDDRIDGVDRENRSIEEHGHRAALRVLAGDLVHTIADSLIAETVVRYRLPPTILSTIREVSALTVAGQACNIRFLADYDDSPRLSDLFGLYDAKTGYYTFVAPLRIGALCAGGTEASPDSLDWLGLLLGRAFQLQDDLEDVAALLANGATEAPRWEFNLVATYLTETGAAAGMSFEEVDTAGLRSWAHRLLSHLRADAHEAAGQLALPPDGRRRIAAFVHGLFDAAVAPGS